MPMGGKIEIRCSNVSDVPSDVSLPEGDTFIEIEIADSGVGLQQDIIDKFFDPYFTTKQEGSGLGLAITLSIITKHNGHIFVTSEQGKGTTFTIYLPASQTTLTEVEVVKKSGKSAKTGTIIIMDDEEIVRSVAKAMLESIGLQ